MIRGEVWVAAGGAPYARKPRPVVVIQTDLVNTTASVLVCPFTTDPTPAPLFRPEIAPSAQNGLTSPCRAMTDKLLAAPRANMERRIGALAPEDLVRIERAIVFLLGIGG